MPKSTWFENEFGNLIALRISDSEDVPAGVRIWIESPDSISEHNLTRREAERLHESLGAFLKLSSNPEN